MSCSRDRDPGGVWGFVFHFSVTLFDRHQLCSPSGCAGACAHVKKKKKKTDREKNRVLHACRTCTHAHTQAPGGLPSACAFLAHGLVNLRRPTYKRSKRSRPLRIQKRKEKLPKCAHAADDERFRALQFGHNVCREQTRTRFVGVERGRPLRSVGGSLSSVGCELNRWSFLGHR